MKSQISVSYQDIGERWIFSNLEFVSKITECVTIVKRRICYLLSDNKTSISVRLIVSL